MPGGPSVRAGGAPKTTSVRSGRIPRTNSSAKRSPGLRPLRMAESSAQQVDLAARRADDQILGLQTGAIGRSTAADAQQPHARRHRCRPSRQDRPAGRWQPPLPADRWKCECPIPTDPIRPVRPRATLLPALPQTTPRSPMSQAFFMFRRPFLKGSRSHTMDAGETPTPRCTQARRLWYDGRRPPVNYTGIPPRRTTCGRNLFRLSEKGKITE